MHKNVKKIKKKINCSKKGKRSERYFVSILNIRFKDILDQNTEWGLFSRTIGSGNRYGQKVILPDAIKNLYTGDLITPGTRFKFTIECKNGYNNIDLVTSFSSNKELDTFINQAKEDASRSNKKPLILWKKDWKPALAILHITDINEHINSLGYYMKYNDWIIISLSDLLKLDDNFFFIACGDNNS